MDSMFNGSVNQKVDCNLVRTILASRWPWKLGYQSNHLWPPKWPLGHQQKLRPSLRLLLSLPQVLQQGKPHICWVESLGRCMSWSLLQNTPKFCSVGQRESEDLSTRNSLHDKTPSYFVVCPWCLAPEAATYLWLLHLASSDVWSHCALLSWPTLAIELSNSCLTQFLKCAVHAHAHRKLEDNTVPH